MSELPRAIYSGWLINYWYNKERLKIDISSIFFFFQYVHSWPWQMRSSLQNEHVFIWRWGCCCALALLENVSVGALTGWLAGWFRLLSSPWPSGSCTTDCCKQWRSWSWLGYSWPHWNYTCWSCIARFVCKLYWSRIEQNARLDHSHEKLAYSHETNAYFLNSRLEKA